MTTPDELGLKGHAAHTNIKWYDMIERDFTSTSRDTGDVPERVTKLVAAFYYMDLLKRLVQAEAERDSLREKLAASEKTMERYRFALSLSRDAMRAPIDDWKGVVERKALDACSAAIDPAMEPKT